MPYPRYAHEYQTIEYTHPRPYVNAGDLSGPDGNAFFIMAKCISTLKSVGYISEINELNFLCMHWQPNYKTSFDKTAFFVNYTPRPQEINLNDMLSTAAQDGDDFVFKVDKKYFLELQRQIDEWDECEYIFNLWTKDYYHTCVNRKSIILEELKAENNLGRNIFSYINNLKDFKKIEDDLFNQGYQRQDIEDLLLKPTLSAASNIDLILWNIKTDSSCQIIHDSFEYLYYLLFNYSQNLNLEKRDRFGKDFLTQLSYSGEIFTKLVNNSNQAKSQPDKMQLIKSAIYLNLCINKLQSMPGYGQSSLHNGKIVQFDLDQQTYLKSYFIEQNKSIFDEQKIILEKQVLDNNLLLNSQKNTIKIKV